MLLSLSDEHKKHLGFFAKADLEGKRNEISMKYISVHLTTLLSAPVFFSCERIPKAFCSVHQNRCKLQVLFCRIRYESTLVLEQYFQGRLARKCL